MSQNSIASRLVMIREKNNLSRPKMASILGVSQNTMGKYERGLLNPSLRVFKLIVEKFDTSLDWLLLNKGPMNYTTVQEAIECQNNDTPPKEHDAIVVTAPEIKELIQFMEENPLFKHQLLTHYYSFKQNPQALQ